METRSLVLLVATHARQLVYGIALLTTLFVFAPTTHAQVVIPTTFSGSQHVFIPQQNAISNQLWLYSKANFSYNTANIDTMFTVTDITDNINLGTWGCGEYSFQYNGTFSSTNYYRHVFSFASMPFSLVAGNTYVIDQIAGCPGKSTVNDYCGTSEYCNGSPELYGFLPTSNIELQKITPVGNPVVNETVTYEVDYTATEDYDHVYYSCDAVSDGYTLHTSNASGNGLFQFICSYDYAFSGWQPAVQLRTEPIDSGGLVIDDFLTIQVVDENTDLTTFRVSPTSILVGSGVTFTLNVDTNYHTNFTGAILNVGLPPNVAPIVTMTGSTYTYTYTTNAGNINIYPKVLVYSDRTKQYLTSLLVTTNGLLNNVLNFSNGGSVTVETGTGAGQYYYFASNYDTYNINDPITFGYFISNIPSCVYDDTDFYYGGVVGSSTKVLQTNAYGSFTHEYSIIGVYTPRLVHNYTCGGTPFSLAPIYLGSLVPSNAGTITIQDYLGYCNTVPYPNSSGIFAYCDALSASINSIPYVGAVMTPVIHGIMWFGSYVFNSFTESEVYQRLLIFIDPKSQVYTFDKTLFVSQPDLVDYIPDSFILQRRQSNTTAIDTLIAFLIHVYFISLVFDLFISTLTKKE